MKQIICFLLLLFFFTSSAHAQRKQGQARIDSLRNLLPQLKDDTAKAEILERLSYAYVRINADSGLMYAQQQLALSESLGWKVGMAGAYNNFGVNYMSKSDYPNGLANYFKALKIYEDIGDKRWIGILSANIGLVYNSKRNYTTAFSYLFKSLKIAEEIKDTMNMELDLGNIGMVYQSVDKDDSALKYQLRALPLVLAENDKGHMASLYCNIGNTYAALKDYHKALEYGFKALKIGEEQNFKLSIAINSGNIGEEYLAIADSGAYGHPDSLVPSGRVANLQKSVFYLTHSIAVCKEISYIGPIEEFGAKLSMAYVSLGNYKAALDAYKEYTEVKDSINSIAKNTQITHLETERAIQLKDKDIYIAKLEIIKKRNERGFFIAGLGVLFVVIIIVFRNYKIQKQTNALLVTEKEKVELRTEELKHSNAELNNTLNNLQATQQQLIVTEKQKENEIIRTRIAMDIHDDISSELTRMSWLSELVKLKYKKAEITEVSALLDKITASSRQTISNLQEIIWTVKPENDNIETLISHIRSYVAKFFGDTAFDYAIHFPEFLPSTQINPELKRNLFLVVKEALNNIAKYSQAGHVDISFHIDNTNHYALTIHDDGRGIDVGIIEGGGNGLKNMQSRMEDIGGTCTINSHPGHGTKITFEGVLY